MSEPVTGAYRPENAYVHANTCDLSSRASSVTEGATTVLPPPGSSSATGAKGRFVVLKEHARGGLGQISLARDEKLKRQVALKEIRPDRRDNDQLRQRFLAEAEITGMLEHPGIVPIYQIDEDASGMPYYAMRFIRGQTFADAIQAFHGQRAPRAAGATPFASLAFRELVQRFISVCNTMAYAHGMGVIHRDLKPANVMLGAYGETLVVDWGLAKKSGGMEKGDDQEATGPNVDEPARASDAGMTEAGQVLGTPNYMSPEQAAGAQVDAATDRYALGAILYELITGQSPYGSGPARAVLAQLLAGAPPSPRALRPDVPRALEAICLKALARRPDERYAIATDVAKDLERWLADEPVAAYSDPPWQRVRRWAKRHRSVVVGMAAAAAVAAVAFALATALLARSNQELLDSMDRETTANKNLREAIGRETTANTVAQQAAQAAQNEAARAREEQQRAETSYRLARNSLDECMLIRNDPRLQAGHLEDIRRKLAEADAHFFQRYLEQRGDDPSFQSEQAKALVALGALTEYLASKQDAIQHYEQALAIYKHLALPQDDGGPAREALAGVHANLGRLYRAVGRFDASATQLGEALKLWEDLRDAHPDKAAYQVRLARAHADFGDLYNNANRPNDADRSYGMARDLLGPLVARKPETLAYQEALADVDEAAGMLYLSYENTWRFNESEEAFKRALASRARLHQADPTSASYRDNLAQTYLRLVKVYSLDVMFGRTSRPTQAEEACNAALGLLESLVQEHPHVPAYRRELCHALISLARVYRSTERRDKAKRAYEDALRAQQQLAELDPQVTDNQVRLADVRAELAWFRRELGDDVDDILRLFAQAIDALEQVRKHVPQDGHARMSLRVAYQFRALTFGLIGRHAESVQDWERAVALETGPSLPWFRMKLAVARAHAGDVARAQSEAEDILGKVKTSLLLYEASRIWAMAAAYDGAPKAAAIAHAIALLRAAAAAGFFKDPNSVLLFNQEKDFGPLRDDGEFKKLVAEFKTP